MVLQLFLKSINKHTTLYAMQVLYDNVMAATIMMVHYSAVQ